MLTKKIILLLLVCAAFFASCSNENKEAADKTADKMADFADDKKFKDQHEKPAMVDFKAMGEMMTYDTPDGKTASAYLLKSKEPSDKYLFVFQEWWGLNDNTKREADKYFAALDNVNVLAPDMYDGKSTDNPDEAGKLMKGTDQERLENIIKGALNYAGDEPEVATIGWCFGGGLSLKASILAGESGKGCVMYYGMPVKTAKELAPLEVPVLGIFAEKDQWINHDVIDEFEKLAAATGKTVTNHWFEADHAFANPSQPRYVEEEAKKANAMAMEFIKKHL